MARRKKTPPPDEFTSVSGYVCVDGETIQIEDPNADRYEYSPVQVGMSKAMEIVKDLEEAMAVVSRRAKERLEAEITKLELELESLKRQRNG